MKFDLQLFDSGEIQYIQTPWLQEVVGQVCKDAMMTGIELAPVQSLKTEDILDWILAFIYDMQKNHSTDLENFLYRTDVDEQLIKQASLHWENVELPEVISRLIFLRCVVKIATRNKYKEL